MNNTTYSRKILSPIQPKVKPVIDVRGENHPIREEVKRLCGNPFTLEVSFKEDTETLKNLNIPGLVGVLCTLKLSGQVIAFGRSVSVFSKLNKYLDRTISASINGSFLSATNNAVKILESIRANGGEEMQGFEGSLQYQEFQPASEKQKSYLVQLANANVEDEDERNQLKSKIEGLNKDEASKMIGGFLDNSINY